MDIYKKIGGYCIICFLLIHCSQINKGNNDRNNKLNSLKMSNYLEQEKEKIQHLMNNFSKPLKKITAIPSAQEVSAIDAVSYKVVNEDVFCVIYVYENQQKHARAYKFFEKHPSIQIKNSITGSNGGLFFWGYQKSDNSKAKYTLNALASAFAGEE